MIVDCTVTVIAGDYTNEASVMIDPDWRDVPVDQTNFPDDSFREYVKQFDTDKDGKLRKRELIAVTEIMIDESDVETLKGIEFFVSSSLRLRMRYSSSENAETMHAEYSFFLNSPCAFSNELRELLSI